MLDAQTIIVALFWFPIFWILGGVIFALIALSRVTKLRKAQFSCLFTLATILCAYGAAASAILLGDQQINACLDESSDMFDILAATFGCGIIEMLIAGCVWMLILILIGLGLYAISRATNQSWIDSDHQQED